MDCKYIIISPAYNEAGYIDFPLKSVIAQTVHPVKWIIVDDGSTDKTAEIIQEASKDYPFIECYKRQRQQGQAYFSSNVYAIMEGYDQVKQLDFDYVAILDADISLPPDYYEELLARLKMNPELGIASGIYENLIEGKLFSVLSDRRFTPKAIMVFRREVFDIINGFIPLKYGGEDTAACIMARMNGWKVWSFKDIKVIHHRPTGLGNTGNIIKAKFTQGLHEWGLGSHPLFVLLKSLKRAVKEKPYLIGGLVRLVGYIYGFIKFETRQIPPDVVKFHQKEQVRRIIQRNRIPAGEVM